MKTLFAWIGRILDPSLLYSAQFSHGGPMVEVDLIGAGPTLLFVATGMNGVPRPLPPPPVGGFLFEITKESERAVISMAALSPLPAGLPSRFTLEADFLLPETIGPWSPDVQWAATLGVRNHDNPDLETFSLAGATHQFRNEGNSDLATRLALGAGRPKATPDIERATIRTAYPDARRHFTLETDIDLDQRLGWSRLRAPGKTWPERTWRLDAMLFPQITGVGFGQAFISGGGVATVTATAFQIYGFYRFRWLRSLLLGLKFRAV